MKSCYRLPDEVIELLPGVTDGATCSLKVSVIIAGSLAGSRFECNTITSHYRKTSLTIEQTSLGS